MDEKKVKRIRIEIGDNLRDIILVALVLTLLLAAIYASVL